MDISATPKEKLDFSASRDAEQQEVQQNVQEQLKKLRVLIDAHAANEKTAS